MSRLSGIGLVLLGIAACSSGDAKEAERVAAEAVENARLVTQRTLPSGVRIDLTVRNDVSSRSDSAGGTMEATVTRDVTNASGTVVIPAGATVFLDIVELQAAQDQGDKDGKLALAANSVAIGGTSYPLVATMEPVTYTLVGRGITDAEAARIGVGTAVGAIVGQAIGKNTRSTVVGGTVGAVAGGVVAVRYAKRDVVVTAGTPVVLTLTESFSVFAR
jgi:hypothetical protein